VGLLIDKVVLEYFSVSVFSFICVINNSTNFSYLIALNEKWMNLRVNFTQTPRGLTTSIKFSFIEIRVYLLTVWEVSLSKGKFICFGYMILLKK
jgi:hypothetical protein